MDSKLFTSSIRHTVLKSNSNTECETNTMLIQEKGMLHECKEIPNSPPKSVLNETLKTHHISVRSLQIDLV